VSGYLLRDPRVFVLVIGVITVAGLGAYHTLPRLEDPKLTNRFAMILTPLPGADAERVEAEVTEPLERELLELDEIWKLQSVSRRGLSVLMIDLRDEIDAAGAESAWTRVRDRLEDARRHLPAEAGRSEFEDDQVGAKALIVAITWTAGGTQGAASAEGAGEPSLVLLGRLGERLEDRLRRLEGTDRTEVVGGAEARLRVTVDRAAMARLGLSAEALSRRVAAADPKLSAGALRDGEAEFIVEVAGEVESLDRLRGIVLASDPDGRVTRLGDVARVERGVTEPVRSMAVLDGRRGVVVTATVLDGHRVDRWAASAREVVQRFERETASGLDVSIVYDESRYTEARLSELQLNFALAVASVIFVVLLMMGWRAAVLVGATLPVTALMVLSGMAVLGMPIHQMSVTGLIIALGLLIDNAIVMVDAYGARRRDGAARGEAVTATVRRLAGPLAGSTATTVLAFTPIAIMPGPAGEFVGGIAWSVILAIVSSFALAMTVTPAAAALLDRAAGKAAGQTASPSARQAAPWWVRGVTWPRGAAAARRGVGLVMRRPWLGVGASLVGPAIGFVLAAGLTEQFFPPTERDQFNLQLWTSEQSSLEATRRATERASAVLHEHPRVEAVHWFIGTSVPRFYYNLPGGQDDQARFAQAMVRLDRAGDSGSVIRWAQRELSARLPESMPIAMQLEQGPPFDAPVELKLMGPDTRRLASLGERARRILAADPDVVATRTTLARASAKAMVSFDDAVLRQVGLTHREAARQLAAATEGAVGGALIEQTETMPITVRMPEGERRGRASFDAITLHGPGGAVIPLSAAATVRFVPETSVIERENGERRNRVFGFLPAGVLPAEVLARYRSSLDEAGFAPPPGYRMAWGGESDGRNRAVSNLMASIAVIVTLAVSVLVLSVGSFRLTGLVAVVGVASVGVGLGALALAGRPFGFMAIVGAMGLIGVAINDSLVVLAAVKADPGARAADPEALAEVVMHESRHVLSTTLTTAAGFMPLIVAGGGIWPPMAIVIAGGVFGATLLALVLAPAGYRILYTAPAALRRGVRAAGRPGDSGRRTRVDAEPRPA